MCNRQRGRRKQVNTCDERQCTSCGTTETPKWRNAVGLTLCNKCGLRSAKHTGSHNPNDRTRGAEEEKEKGTEMRGPWEKEDQRRMFVDHACMLGSCEQHGAKTEMQPDDLDNKITNMGANQRQQWPWSSMQGIEVSTDLMQGVGSGHNSKRSAHNLSTAGKPWRKVNTLKASKQKSRHRLLGLVCKLRQMLRMKHTEAIPDVLLEVQRKILLLNLMQRSGASK